MKRFLAVLLFTATGILAALDWRPELSSTPAAIADDHGERHLNPDSVAAIRDSLMNVVLAGLAGRENAPAESIFKNIQIFQGVPAARIPRIMNMGFGRSLGVACDHCHVVGEWDKDEKHGKQIARDMFAMVNTINRDHLAKIQNLESKQPVVNCTTCHRGDVKPATNMP